MTWKKKKRNHQWAEPLIESHASHSEIALSMITQGSIHRGLLVSKMRWGWSDFYCKVLWECTHLCYQLQKSIHRSSPVLVCPNFFCRTCSGNLNRFLLRLVHYKTHINDRHAQTNPLRLLSRSGERWLSDKLTDPRRSLAVTELWEQTVQTHVQQGQRRAPQLDNLHLWA